MVICEARGCVKRAHFSFRDMPLRFCSKHKLPGMVGDGHHCQHPGCEKSASFGTPGASGERGAMLRVFCAAHKREGMVNMAHPHCQHEKCTKRPSFGMPGMRPGSYCAEHKKPGMINVTSDACAAAGCARIASFNFAGETCRFCKKHMQDGMVNVRQRRVTRNILAREQSAPTQSVPAPAQSTPEPAQSAPEPAQSAPRMCADCCKFCDLDVCGRCSSCAIAAQEAERLRKYVHTGLLAASASFPKFTRDGDSYHLATENYLFVDVCVDSRRNVSREQGHMRDLAGIIGKNCIFVMFNAMCSPVELDERILALAKRIDSIVAMSAMSEPICMCMFFDEHAEDHTVICIL